MPALRLHAVLGIASLLAAITPAAGRSQEYTVTDLGVTGAGTQPWSVNGLGQVAGYARLPDGHDEGFFHDSVAAHFIGTPGPTTRSDLLGANDLGEAVGKSGTVHENGEALLRRADGTVLQLGTLGGSRSAAMAINDASRVVGWTKLAGDAESRPFVWEDGVMTALPLLGGGQGSADWINDAGQIVGASTTDTDGLTQFAVIWDGGSVARLPPVDPQHPSLNHIANFIHDDGSIAGSVRLAVAPSGFRTRAAVWHLRDLVLQLGTLADGTPAEAFATSWASAVNASGVVVGMSVNAQSALVPFVYRSGEMVQLDDLVPAPWVCVFVGSGSLNDAGQITVSAVGADGSTHALLLTPIAPTGAPASTGTRTDAGYLAVHGERITFAIPRPGPVTLSLFDVAGRLVARPVDGVRGAGSHEVTWDGRSRGGSGAPAGVYFVRLSASGYSATERMVRVR